MKKIVMIVSALALAATAATAKIDCGKMGGAGCPMNAKTEAGAKKTVAAIRCAVTGEKIASAAKAGGKSVYKARTYYFCCAGCKPKFDKAPAKYVKNSAKGIYEKM